MSKYFKTWMWKSSTSKRNHNQEVFFTDMKCHKFIIPRIMTGAKNWLKFCIMLQKCKCENVLWQYHDKYRVGDIYIKVGSFKFKGRPMRRGWRNSSRSCWYSQMDVELHFLSDTQKTQTGQCHFFDLVANFRCFAIILGVVTLSIGFFSGCFS